MLHKREILAATAHTVLPKIINWGLFIAYHAECGYCHTSTEGQADSP